MEQQAVRQQKHATTIHPLWGAGSISTVELRSKRSAAVVAVAGTAQQLVGHSDALKSSVARFRL